MISHSTLKGQAQDLNHYDLSLSINFGFLVNNEMIEKLISLQKFIFIVLSINIFLFETFDFIIFFLLDTYVEFIDLVFADLANGIHTKNALCSRPSV